MARTETWAAAGLMLLAAARERRGERARRAMTDILAKEI